MSDFSFICSPNVVEFAMEFMILAAVMEKCNELLSSRVFRENINDRIKI